METLNTTFTEMKSFLEKVSRLPYPDRTMFVSILIRDEDTINVTLNLYDILERSYPSWLHAFVNAHEFEVGREEAIEDILGDYLTLGEI
jgi:hypothetical protein